MLCILIIKLQKSHDSVGGQQIKPQVNKNLSCSNQLGQQLNWVLTSHQAREDYSNGKFQTKMFCNLQELILAQTKITSINSAFRTTAHHWPSHVSWLSSKVRPPSSSKQGAHQSMAGMGDSSTLQIQFLCLDSLPQIQDRTIRNLQDLQRDTGLALAKQLMGAPCWSSAMATTNQGRPQPTWNLTSFTIVQKAGATVQDSGVVLNPFIGVQHSYKVMSSDIPLIDPEGGLNDKTLPCPQCRLGSFSNLMIGGCHCYYRSTQGYFKLYLGAMGWYPSPPLSTLSSLTPVI